MTAEKLQSLEHRMAIWPDSPLRVANKAQQYLYDEIARTGSTAGKQGPMQTRAALYDLIDLASCDELDSSIVASRLSI